MPGTDPSTTHGPRFPPTLWALVERAADEWAGHVLLADDYGRSLTGRQLRDTALGVAADLQTRGIGAGTVVSWQLPTALETMVVMVALSRLGAAQNPLIPILREREVSFITAQAGTQVFIVAERWRGFEHGTLARRLAAERGVDVIIADLDTDPASIGNTMRLPTGDPTTLASPAAPDSRAIRWLYSSSGTTADPKGIRHTDASVMASATGTIDAAGATPDDVNALAIPISHIGGITMLTSSLVSGMQLLLFDTFDPATTPERMAARGATLLGSAVPFFLAYFAAQRRHGDTPLFPSLRAMFGGGAPTPAEINRDAREILGVHGIGSSWGLTEFPVATFPAPDSPIEVLDHTVGRPVAGVSVRVVAVDGNEVDVGHEGELRLKGPQCFQGYIDARLDTDAFDDEGWFRTGDLGVINPDGNVSVTGRLKDIIIRNAENISALEVEEALYRHPDVVDAAVVGAPDPRTGERVCAFIVLAPDATLTLDDVAGHCRSLGLAIQKTPEQLVIIPELPRNTLGKVLKHELRSQLSARS